MSPPFNVAVLFGAVVVMLAKLPRILIPFRRRTKDITAADPDENGTLYKTWYAPLSVTEKAELVG